MVQSVNSRELRILPVRASQLEISACQQSPALHVQRTVGKIADRRGLASCTILVAPVRAVLRIIVLGYSYEKLQIELSMARALVMICELSKTRLSATQALRLASSKSHRSPGRCWTREAARSLWMEV